MTGKAVANGNSLFVTKRKGDFMNKRKHRIWKRILTLFSFIMILSVPVQAKTPLSLSLDLEKSSMDKGETMQVSVSLQNYDENFKENDITTMVIVVSVNTELLEIDKDSVAMAFEEGSRKTFSVAQKKDDSNVELQYLDLVAPLKKGTKTLYTFEVTALKDIKNLLSSINISYVVLQDGTKEESERLTVVPFVMVDGKAVEQETIEEKFTSENGTMEIDTEKVSQVIDKINKETANLGNQSAVIQETTKLGDQSVVTPETTKKENSSVATQETTKKENSSPTHEAEKSEQESQNNQTDEKKETEPNPIEESDTHSDEENKENKKQNEAEKSGYASVIIIMVVVIVIFVFAAKFFLSIRK